MRTRNWALLLGLAGFVGCGAEPGNDGSAEPDVEHALSAATSCETFTGTILQHLDAGRVTGVNSTFFIWVITTYYPVGSPQESLGTDANKSVTLYNKPGGGFTSNAATCAATDCGNGRVETPEECDGAIPDAQSSCAQSGYVAGKLKCTAQCKIDSSDCKLSVCGNGTVENLEECDGTVPPGHPSCVNLSATLYASGNPRCSSDCKFDTSTCVRRCGNGVLDSGEQCDGSVFSSAYAGKTCSSIDNPDTAFPFRNVVKYGSGALHCNEGCQVATDLCKPAPGCYVHIVNRAQSTIVCY